MIFIDVSIPVEIVGIANSIARAIDPDTGGDKTFVPFMNIPGEFIQVSLPLFDSFAPQVPILLSNPVLLHEFVLSDYATRWTDLVPPSFEDVVLFCNSLEILLPPAEIVHEEEFLSCG